MAMDISGSRVLVVGAAGGIGQATAEALAAAGAEVTAAGRSEESVAAIVERIDGTAAALDILDNDRIEAFFASEQPFDHVVIAAASAATGPVADLPLDQAEAAMNSKFWGAYRIARAARINDGGSLTLISGMLAERPSATSVLQGAINAALEALARGLALERSPVRVNAVSPGLIDTPLHDRMPPDAREAMYDSLRRKLPARRMGKPEDVAQAVLLAAANPSSPDRRSMSTAAAGSSDRDRTTSPTGFSRRDWHHGAHLHRRRIRLHRRLVGGASAWARP